MRIIRKRRNKCLHLVQPHVPLALLFGVVKRMAVEKVPDKVPGNILETELEMRVLKNGVMPTIKGGGANR